MRMSYILLEAEVSALVDAKILTRPASRESDWVRCIGFIDTIG